MQLCYNDLFAKMPERAFLRALDPGFFRLGRRDARDQPRRFVSEFAAIDGVGQKSELPQSPRELPLVLVDE